MDTRTITINIQPLFEEVNYSNLSLPNVLGAGVINVYNISKFAISQLLCIGEPGSKGSEFIKTHAATGPTGTTVTLASNLTKDHAKDVRVYIVNYNQVEFSHADTETGSKSILATNAIDAETIENFYRDNANSSGFYFTRFKNDILSSTSAYSDPIPFGGIADNTVGYAIESAMSDLGAEFGTPPTLTFDKLLRDARQMLKLVRGKMKAWSKYQEYDYVVDTIDKTAVSYVAPASLYDKNSNRSILSLRVENALPLSFIDRTEYVEKTSNIVSGDEIGTPEVYSIWDGNIYLWPYGNDESQGKDLIMDFYTDIETINSQSDIILGTKYDMLIPYLKWKIRAVTENNGKEDLKDPSYAEFRELLTDAKNNDLGAEEEGFHPRNRAVRQTRDRASNHYL